MRCARTLNPAEWQAYEAHLLRLDSEARRLRFGYKIDDRAIRAHVASLVPARDRILAVVEGGRVVAAAHIARAAAEPEINTGTVELAFSVDADKRGQGFGRLLFDQALAWSRNRGLRRAALYFLADNHAIRRLASRAGMSVEGRAGEYEAIMALPPATPFSLARELAAERWALWEEQSRRQLPGLLVARPAF